VVRPSGRRLSFDEAKSVGLKPDPQKSRCVVGRPSGRRLSFDAAKVVGLKPDPQNRAVLWVGLQADAIPLMGRTMSG
jgi:hypothetical protein